MIIFTVTLTRQASYHSILSEILRTPISAFVNLSDYPFQPNYIDLLNPGSIRDGKTKLRLHYLDEGNKSSPETILLLHGEPSWSYLYRHFISKLKKYRVIAVDLTGFGFGSLIGLQLVGTNGVGDRFAQIVAANDGLPIGNGKISKGFIQWLDFASQQTEMDVGRVIKSGVIKDMKQEEIDAYNAPFPNEQYQAGALVFPLLVPITPENPSSEFNRQAWKNLKNFNRPFLTLFSDSDPITGGLDKILQSMIPGAKNQSHTTITDAGHFLQEDKPHEIVEHLIKFIKDNPLILARL
ncbi:unnamed protein product [Adineta steineri]|uniref:Haloalkane dehalogenase n=2 Tax=Adineta steineri TaxID=433720 RepID=A0A814E3M9_9BILA|nr:unnamed protein product [Adineta steineri]CAF4072411.1 unnamed protein product [Adineta steineri]